MIDLTASYPASLDPGMILLAANDVIASVFKLYDPAARIANKMRVCV